MKISNKQAHMLLLLLRDSLTMKVQGYLSTTHNDRTDLFNEIINQQDSTLVNLDDR